MAEPRLDVSESLSDRSASRNEANLIGGRVNTWSLYAVSELLTMPHGDLEIVHCGGDVETVNEVYDL